MNLLTKKNLLIVSLVFSFLFCVSLYERQLGISFIFFLVCALFWILYIEEIRIARFKLFSSF